MNRYQRVIDLFELENFKRLQDAKVLLIGVGGVGGFCLDCLYRSGITNITIVDFDTYDITNQNRQIGSEAVGDVKVDRLKELYPQIKSINLKIDIDWIDNFDFDNFDVVLDAIDDIAPKVALIKKAHKLLISSMGSAKKSDPTQIMVGSLWKTINDPLAKKVKERLKKDKFSKNIKVVFSKEPVITKQNGSFVGVTGAFGLTMCSETIKKILKTEINNG